MCSFCLRKRILSEIQLLLKNTTYVCVCVCVCVFVRACMRVCMCVFSYSLSCRHCKVVTSKIHYQCFFKTTGTRSLLKTWRLLSCSSHQLLPYLHWKINPPPRILLICISEYCEIYDKHKKCYHSYKWVSNKNSSKQCYVRRNYLRWNDDGLFFSPVHNYFMLFVNCLFSVAMAAMIISMRATHFFTPCKSWPSFCCHPFVRTSSVMLACK